MRSQMFAIIFVLLGIIIHMIYRELKNEDHRVDMAFKELVAVKKNQYESTKRIETIEKYYKFSENCESDLAEIKLMCEKFRKKIVTLQDKVSQKAVTVEIIRK